MKQENMEEKKLNDGLKLVKMAFSGNSGIGKTTLSKFVEQEFGLKRLPTSAGDILTGSDKALLKEKYGYDGTGHKNVINLSAFNPSFGWDFQKKVLNRRADQIFLNEGFVMDRSPIDNVAYMLMQDSHNQSEEEVKAFIHTAQLVYHELTHVIQFRFSSDIPFVENNGSRIPNRYFQQYTSDVFAGVYARYFANIVGPRVLTIDFWDLRERKSVIREFIRSGLDLTLPM